MALRTQPRVRVLGPVDLDAVRRLLLRDPITHVFVDHRIRVTRMEPRWLGGEIWGYQEGDELVSICHAAANLAPVLGTPESLDAFAARALAQGRRAARSWAPRQEVRHLWRILGPEWGPARSIRPHQPFMVLDPHRPSRLLRTYAGCVPTSSTSSTPPAWRCTPRSSASHPRRTAARRSTGPGSPS